MKFQTAIIFSILFSACSMAQKEAKLIYYGDPMCSWCYGFSPELTKAMSELEKEVELEFIMGGLRPYGTETMEELGDFLKHHWEDVNRRSGQPFRYGILEDKDFIYDTEPACRAVQVVKKLKPEVEFDFFKAVQEAFYFKNKNTSMVLTYSEIAETFGIDKTIFENEFESTRMKELTREGFAKSNDAGVRGFPTLIFLKAGKSTLISNGYAESEDIVAKVKLLLEK